MIKLPIPCRFSFEIAGDKGLTLSQDIDRGVRSSLAMIGFSSGFQVAWPICFHLIPRFDLVSGVKEAL